MPMIRRGANDRPGSLLIPPLTIYEEILARPERLRVFVSSKMSGGSLAAERKAAAKAVESLGGASAWYWERDARGGPRSAAKFCEAQAGSSDALILILEDELTPITKREYQAAKRNGLWRCILVREGSVLTTRAQAFLDREARSSIYKSFRNLRELHSHVINSLWFGLAHGFRESAALRRGYRAKGGK